MTDRTIPKNDIYYSTREAELPNFTECDNKNAVDIKENETFDNPKAEKTVIKAQKSQNPDPEFQCVPEDAPEIMQATARYLLQRTGREKLAWPEIAALRSLTITHVPARVQKEIDRAYNRFVKSGRDLKTLRFEYIASSLQNQPPTLGRRKNSKTDEEKIKKACEELKPKDFEANTDEQAEAEMRKIAELQAKLGKGM